MGRAFHQSKLWFYLKRNPGQHVREIAEGMGLSKRAVSSLLNRMKIEGHATRVGGSHQCKWWADGGVKPVSGYGLHPNSLANLQLSLEEKMRYLKLAYEARGIDPDRSQQKRPPKQCDYPCTLDKYWLRPPANNGQ